MNLFKIEPGLFIWTWITFGLLFLILAKFVFPNLLKGVKLREQKIADSVTNAEEIEKRLASIEKEHEQMVADTNKKADEILRKTRAEADRLKDQLKADAEREAAQILNEARRKIEEERAQILASLSDELAEFVCNASEKLVERSFTGDEEKEWARELAGRL